MSTQPEAEDFQCILTRNFYLFSKYILPEDILPELISANVISVDDKELILNRCINHNRRERANKLIEILMTRGEEGFTTFVNLLEYHYPHVYREVTKKEPRNPPAGFRRNRESDRLRIIDDLPVLAQRIKEQLYENHELDAQLSVLQQLLEVSKEEKLSLEKEVETLKNIRVENDRLHLKIQTLMSEKNDLQTECTNWMAKSFQYLESQTELKDKCQLLQVHIDELTQQLERLSASGTPPMPDQLRQVPRTCKFESLPPKANHVRAQNNILQEELDNYRSQCEEITSRLQRSEEDLTKLERALREKEKKIMRIQHEKDTLQSDYAKECIKSKLYFDALQKKSDEIFELRDSKRAEDQRMTDKMKENQEYLCKIHELEMKLVNVQSELNKIKARNSGSSLDSTSSVLSCSDEENDEPERRQNIKKVHPRCNIWNESHSQRHATDISSHFDELEGNENMKSSTLPHMANESPETMFQREIAYFRYSKQGDHRKVDVADSMAVQHGSMIEKERLFITNNDPVTFSNERLQPVVYDNISKEPVMHPGDAAEDIVDTASSVSTVYVPRNNGGGRQNGNLPSRERNCCREPNEQFTIESIINVTDSADLNQSTDLSSDFLSHEVCTNLLPRECAVEPNEQFTIESIINVTDSADLNQSTDLSSDFLSHEVCTNLLPRECAVVSRPGMLDKHMCRCVTVKFPIIGDKIEIKGGNHTGIFITKVLKGQELSEGEQIKEIVYTPNADVPAISTLLRGYTLEEVHRLLSEDFIRPKKEKEVKLSVRRCQQENDSACQWMQEHGNSGDFFFIRCNVNMEKKSVEELSLRSGDVFLVRNSLHGDRQWLGYIVDVSNGHPSPNPVVIPNPQLANLRRFPLSCIRSNSDDDENKSKRKAIKFKGCAYDRVLPVKACLKLPVLIVGPDVALVQAVLNLIAKELPSKFKVNTSSSEFIHSRLNVKQSDLNRQDIHHVKGGNFENLKARKSLQQIIILVKVTMETKKEENRRNFGEYFDLDFTTEMIGQGEILKTRLTESGQSFEVVLLPGLTNKEHLINCIKAHVESLQNRILWLSKEEMDEQLAKKYPSYLGHDFDIVEILNKVQTAQYFEKTA